GCSRLGGGRVADVTRAPPEPGGSVRRPCSKVAGGPGPGPHRRHRSRTAEGMAGRAVAVPHPRERSLSRPLTRFTLRTRAFTRRWGGRMGQRTARFTAETIALNEAVVIDGSIPTPQITWSRTSHST